MRSSLTALISWVIGPYLAMCLYCLGIWLVPGFFGTDALNDCFFFLFCELLMMVMWLFFPSVLGTQNIFYIAFAGLYFFCLFAVMVVFVNSAWPVTIFAWHAYTIIVDAPASEFREGATQQEQFRRRFVSIISGPGAIWLGTAVFALALGPLVFPRFGLTLSFENQMLSEQAARNITSSGGPWYIFAPWGVLYYGGMAVYRFLNKKREKVPA